MCKENQGVISQERLGRLSLTVGITEIENMVDFEHLLKSSKAIIYFLVDWSGLERVARYCVYKTLIELNQTHIPIYKIDCSDQKKIYILDWLSKQQENKKDFYFGGWGSTVLIKNGNVVDSIKNPSQLGFEKTKEKFQEWILK